MKKLLVLLTLAVALFGFSAGAFAQALDVCSTCGHKCALGVVACPQAGQSAAVCEPFDFETGAGYSSGRGTYPTDYCNAVFSICNCLNAGTTFVAGHRIGIRMTILVNGQAGQLGAYWSAPSSANVEFAMYATSTEACTTPVYTQSFGPGKFFKTNSSGVATTEVTSLASGSTCTVGTANQATQIITNVEAGYTITLADETNKLSRWRINIPWIRIDPAVLKNGEKISVKIETLDQATGGICADCVATCECIVDVALVCSDLISGSECLFPYFTSTTAPNDGQPWWNGIAITNTSAYPGTATLSVHQSDGTTTTKTGTYTTPTIPAGGIFVRALEAISFTGTGLGDVPAWIQVTTTFPTMDGFAIIADTSTGESMGYLCRKPSAQ